MNIKMVNFIYLIALKSYFAVLKLNNVLFMSDI